MHPGHPRRGVRPLILDGVIRPFTGDDRRLRIARLGLDGAALVVHDHHGRRNAYRRPCVVDVPDQRPVNWPVAEDVQAERQPEASHQPRPDRSSINLYGRW